MCLVCCCCSIQRCCCCWFVICAKYTLTSHIHKHWRIFVFLVRYFTHVHSAHAHTYTPNTIVKLLIFFVCCLLRCLFLLAAMVRIRVFVYVMFVACTTASLTEIQRYSIEIHTRCSAFPICTRLCRIANQLNTTLFYVQNAKSGNE